jgi:predicted transcriptional regulator
METRVVTAHIPIELAQQMDQLSERLERPRGWIVKQALCAWVALEAKRHQLTLEALGDVDAGRLIPQTSVEAWAESLDKPA